MATCVAEQRKYNAADRGFAAQQGRRPGRHETTGSPVNRAIRESVVAMPTRDANRGTGVVSIPPRRGASYRDALSRYGNSPPHPAVMYARVHDAPDREVPAVAGALGDLADIPEIGAHRRLPTAARREAAV